MTLSTLAPARSTRLAAAALLLLASAAAPAADTAGARATTGVGQWIADQGNAALRQLGDELRRNLADTFKPLLPAPSPTVAGPDAGRVADERAQPAAVDGAS